MAEIDARDTVEERSTASAAPLLAGAHQAPGPRKAFGADDMA